MKKRLLIIILVLLSLFIVAGCTNNKKSSNEKNTSIENEKEIYIKTVKKLEKIKTSSEELPFTVEVKYDQIKDEIRYQVIIDNPKEEIKGISALAIHNKQTDDVFPSVGIFDKKVNLIPNKKPSGVILVGYFPYEGKINNLDVEVKVYISYKMNKKEYTSYYVTKK